VILYDAHNHLQDDRLARHREQILNDCQSTGVAKMVVNGTHEADWPLVLELSRRRDQVIPSFGYHPWYLKRHTAKWKDALNHHLDQAPHAVGEIGLDRWMKDHDPALQEEMFVAQLEIASERNLPTSIHCLKASGRLLELLQAGPVPARGFLLHSYNGSAEMIPRFEQLGAYFSISGYFAHERKEKHVEILKQIPIERLLIETDAPDMLPPNRLVSHPVEGGLNHPANLRSVYEFAATIFELPIEEFTHLIARNFQRLFLP